MEWTRQCHSFGIMDLSLRFGTLPKGGSFRINNIYTYLYILYMPAPLVFIMETCSIRLELSISYVSNFHFLEL